MQVHSKRAIYTLTILYFLFSPILSAFVAPAAAAETVTLQLKWKHQFQFSGYYAAIEKGYYDKVGLHVELREASPGFSIAREMQAGHAEYAVAMPNMLLERQKGEEVVALAAIFQHSPEALFLRKDSTIHNPQDLIGRRIMLRPNGNSETRAMLLNEGIKPGQVTIIPHTWNINDLISGKVSASGGYLTDRPFILQKLGVEYSTILPLAYGVDFYGDCLFTTEKEIKNHPQRVKDFLTASLKGWQYAMNHQEEIVDLILKKYSTRLSKEALLFEANAMTDLMLPKFIEIGHMNTGRWRHIADTFIDLGMLNPDFSLKGFIYSSDSQAGYLKMRKFVLVLFLVLISISSIGLVLIIFNRRLRKEVARKTAELEKEKQFVNLILKTIPGIFYVCEDGKRLIRWNEKLQRESGFSDKEMRGRHPLQWFHGKEKTKIAQALKNITLKGGIEMEANINFNRGEVPYYFTATMLEIEERKFLVGVGIDLTIRRQLEEQLSQAQKMESIGRLAGGVAHDFNNVLTTILGYSELILDSMPDTDPHRSEITIIHDAGERAAALTRQLLAFSRKQLIEKKPVSMNFIITDLMKILGKMLGEDIIVKTYLTEDSDIIDADVGQIEQIIMNLAVNAKDAMPVGGNINIATMPIALDKNYSALHVDIKPGAYIVLSVSDEGEGMDKEITEQIFDPFFTTKEIGKGTGLGLATVYGIVKQHNGHIHVYSELNKGTIFKIYFPASNKAEDSNTRQKKTIPPATGNETIMVVDDDANIRKLILATLQPLGYQCLEAANGNKALEISKRYPENIHLLLTDVVMPGMNGKKLAKIFSEENPAAKIIFMSGYTENSITDMHNQNNAQQNAEETSTNYIAKPITPMKLTRKIRSILDLDDS